MCKEADINQEYTHPHLPTHDWARVPRDRHRLNTMSVNKEAKQLSASDILGSRRINRQTLGEKQN